VSDGRFQVGNVFNEAACTEPCSRVGTRLWSGKAGESGVVRQQSGIWMARRQQRNKLLGDHEWKSQQAQGCLGAAGRANQRPMVDKLLTSGGRSLAMVTELPDSSLCQHSLADHGTLTIDSKKGVVARRTPLATWQHLWIEYMQEQCDSRAGMQAMVSPTCSHSLGRDTYGMK